MAYSNVNDKSDSGFYTTIKVVRNEDLYQQIGRDVYCDLVNHDKIRCFWVLNSTPFNHFKKMVATRFGVPLQLQRFWIWEKRANLTYRPHRPLTHEEETQPVYQLKKVQTKAGKWELILFLEVLETMPESYTFRPWHKTEEDILLFFKLYDPEKEEIRYVGKLFVKGSAMPGDILDKLNEMANFAPFEEIELYQEINFKPIVMCELVHKECTFSANQLKNGDIICFQKAHDPAQMKFRYPCVLSFLKSIHRFHALALQQAKSKVIAKKNDLKKAEDNVTPLQIKVTSIKNKMKEVEENIANLHCRAIELEDELKEAENNMAPLQLTEIAMKDELQEAEEEVATLMANMRRVDQCVVM
ncbi:hypothetical protein MKW92_053044 [Papaver armeniacum]|nr:hypothetical protein MKW92_053044 [Papaver armeniacum]